MVTKDKINEYDEYFRFFELHWIPAVRSIRGRPSEGMLCGVKRMNSAMVKMEIQFLNEKILVQLESQSGKYFIIPLYLNYSKWEDEFLNMQNMLIDLNKENVLLIGDFNVRLGQNQKCEAILSEMYGLSEHRKSQDEKTDGRGLKFLDLCSEYGMIILNGRMNGDENGEFTYISQTGSSVIDLCCASGEWFRHIKEFEVIDKLYTKHMPIVVTAEFGEGRARNREMNLLPQLTWVGSRKGNYARNLEILVAKMEEKVENIESLNDKLIDTIKNAAAATMIKKNIWVRKEKWFDFQCYALRSRSYALLKLLRRTYSNQVKLMYLDVIREYKKVCRDKKEMYHSNMAKKLAVVKDSRSFWRTIRELVGCKKLCGRNIHIGQLANYFSIQLNPPITARSIQYACRYIEDPILDRAITMEELKIVLSRVKNNKAPGIDRVGYEFFKNAPDTFLNKLIYLYNMIMRKKKMPEAFKKSIIFPLYKKGNADDPSNYRAISYADAIAKIFTGILLKRLNAFIEQHKSLSEFQAGFRPGYSTIDNIYTVTNLVKLYKIKKRKLYSFFIDLKAAFDMIDRNALIYKLNEIGLSYNFLSIIRDLYTDTKAVVWDGNNVSEEFPTVMGLKQGCILSPTFFSLFIDDVTKILPGGANVAGLEIKILLYADDIVIFAESREALQLMINRIGKYFETWNLQINLEKSKIMIFSGGGRMAKNERWFYHGQQIEVVNEYKYLGVILTTKLSWAKHFKLKFAQATTALNATWWKLLGNRNIAHSVKYKIFNTTMQSIMCYAAQVWGYEEFNDVEKLQRFFIKRVFWLPVNTPNYMLYTETGLAPIFVNTLKLQIDYICKIMSLKEDRLPRKLANIILNKGELYIKEWRNISDNCEMILDINADNISEWKGKLYDLVKKVDEEYRRKALASARNSMHRNIYNELRYDLGENNYFKDSYEIKVISAIFKARGELLNLAFVPHKDTDSTMCTLCNTGRTEDIMHFLAYCPVLREVRKVHFQKLILTNEEAFEYLNGKRWDSLAEFIIEAYNYRKRIIMENF